MSGAETSTAGDAQATLLVREPATEAILARVGRAGVEQVDEAVAAAKRAFPAWAALSPEKRSSTMLRLADGIESRLEELALTEARNVGKPIGDARGEIAMVVKTFRYFAASPERPSGETIPVDGGFAYTVREPVGVVGLIVPWNFPLAIASWKIAPALAAGNTVVLKPAELTPLTAMRLAEIAAEVELPAGVLNVVVGSGSSCGRRLVEHPDVAKIAFTGSTAVGSEVAAAAARGIKRVTLELGGKSANIVFADADVELAAREAPAAVFANAGQDCCARSRILVEASVADRFLEHLTRAVSEVRVGDPLDEATQMGPLISAEHRQNVASFVGPDSTIAAVGAIPSGSGFWFPPTVLCPVAAGDRAVEEEIFGPVAVVVPFADEAEAIAIENASVYGLSGSIWTRDVGRAHRVARAVQSGNLSVNSHSSVRVVTPFGGFKQSGYGRELGPHATDAYSEVKTVFVATA